jgi:hypothetical protein
MLHRFTIASNEGPKILWEQLKGKKVKTNDGHGVREIKEIAQNYIRLEKGIVNKDKSWVPKYLVDAYDGKVLWLVISNDDLTRVHSYTTEQNGEQHTHDFEAFKATPYGQKAIQLPDFEQNIRMTDERKSNTSIGSGDEYKNIRHLE